MAFLRFFGKLLISVGAGVLMFVAWFLWGTGIYTAQQQDRLSEEFDRIEVFAEPVSAGGQKSGPLKVHGPPADYDPAAGDPVFRLRIPKTDDFPGLRKMVVEGVGEEELKAGPGHYPECDEGFEPPHCTDFPTSWPGDKGRVIVSGHRTTYGAPFYYLDALEPGDSIITETKWGTYRYRVTEQRIVDDEDVTVTVQVHSKRELVLTTCNPRYSAAQRLVIYSELEERIE